MDSNVKLDKLEKTDKILNQWEPDLKLSTRYAMLIRSLMYLALGARPGIAYSVNKLAQFTHNPKLKHWTAVKQIFWYLKGTRAHILTYSRSNNLLSPKINIYCNADWASDADQKSVSRNVITMAGGAVSWSSKKQAMIALSTTEAEYIAATHVVKQVLWHQSLFHELQFLLLMTSTIFSDNQATILITHYPEFHSRTNSHCCQIYTSSWSVDCQSWCIREVSWPWWSS